MISQVHKGWLTKSPMEKKFFRSQSKKYFFMLVSLNGSHDLSYFKDETCLNKRGSINLKDCVNVWITDESNGGSTRTIQLATLFKNKSRVYYLEADTPAEADQWLVFLRDICGLDKVEVEGDQH